MNDKGGTYIINKLEQSGFEAYFVGGCVRDTILKRRVYDYDITTNATPLQIKGVFFDEKIFDTGIRHGTVTICVYGKNYEVTTFRCDGEYLDNRHPKNVQFVTSLKDDLLRRDFTINAMAVGLDNQIIDYYGGFNDIEHKIIRCVGDPYKRFSEDALRILRAVRFSAQLGFVIENDTYKNMVLLKSNLKSISVERIYSELTKIVTAKYASSAIDKCKEIIFEVIPELAPTYSFGQKSLSHDYDVFHHTLKVLSLIKNKNEVMCFSALFHDIGKPNTFIVDEFNCGHTFGHEIASVEITKGILSRLKAPNLVKKQVLILIENHDKFVGESKYDVKLFLSKYGLTMAKYLYELKTADLLSHSIHGIQKYNYQRYHFRDYLNEIVNNNECYTLKNLKVNGKDLESAGVLNVNIGKVLNKILLLVMGDKLENNYDIIMEYVKHNFI